MNNSVELIGHYGSDEIIACSAWTSTSRNLTEEKRNRIPKMIHDLWTAGHKTPFEKGIVHFLVDTEIASHIHILKHRISSMNGESARYKELKEDKFYLPSDWAGIQLSESVMDDDGYFAVGKDLYEEDAEEWLSVLEQYTELGNKLYHLAIKDLEPVLGRKRAKESARFFKTYNSQIEGDLMFNMSSFANFLKLRDSGKAQKEIKELANRMAQLILEIPGNPFKETMKVFGYE